MTKQMFAGILLMTALTVSAVNAQTIDPQQLRTRIDEGKMIYQRVQYVIQTLSTLSDRLESLALKADEQDKARLTTAITAIQQEVDKFSANLQQAQTIAEDASALYSAGKYLECASKIDAYLARIRLLRDEAVSRYREYSSKIGTLEQEIRKKIATFVHAEKAVKRTDAVLARAAAIAKKTGNGSEAFPGLRRAYELQEKAKQALVALHPWIAINLTFKARDVIGETVQSALDSADIAAVKQRAVAFYTKTESMIKRISAQVDMTKDTRLVKLLNEAIDLQAKAKEAADAGQAYKAIRAATRAREIVEEIISFAHRVDNIDSRIERVGSRIARATEIIEESGNEKAVAILEKAVTHFDKGKELWQADKDKAATVELDIAVKLATKATDMAKGDLPVRGLDMGNEIRKTEMIVKRAESLATTDQQKAAVARAQAAVAEAREKIAEPQVCLKILDRATDIAFTVINQVRTSQK